MFERIIRKLFKYTGMFCSRATNRTILHWLMTASKAFDKGLCNVNFDIHSNGEMFILKTMSLYGVHRVFDVGANVGEYTAEVKKACPDAEIHSFEIVPTTYQELVENISAENAILVNCGLSNYSGKTMIHVSSRENTTATAFKIDGMHDHDDYYKDAEVIECDVITGHEYVEKNMLDVIDFLKIDVEGMDYHVLEGMGESLNKVKVIQFEYGVFNISSKKLLIDFYRLLSPFGFSIGQIMPKGVLFSEYHFNMENFYGNNYLAVKKSETELINKLTL